MSAIGLTFRTSRGIRYCGICAQKIKKGTKMVVAEGYRESSGFHIVCLMGMLSKKLEEIRNENKL